MKVRGKHVLLLAVAAGVLAIVPSASAATAPGALNCPGHDVYNSTHWKVMIGETVNCTIEGATDVSGATVDVFIKSTTSGNTTVPGIVVGHTIAFSYTASADRCDTNIVAYGTNGNNSNNSIITSGGTSAAGFGYVDASGNPVSCSTPTAVTFRGLAADRTARGVVVRWQTSSELGTIGYNVYREAAGKRVKLNRSLISAGSGLSAHSYSWLDRSGKTGRYWVQAVERNGARVWRGPASAQ
jgi:hypothetical protein